MVDRAGRVDHGRAVKFNLKTDGKTIFLTVVMKWRNSYNALQLPVRNVFPLFFFFFFSSFLLPTAAFSFLLRFPRDIHDVDSRRNRPFSDLRHGSYPFASSRCLARSNEADNCCGKARTLHYDARLGMRGNNRAAAGPNTSSCMEKHTSTIGCNPGTRQRNVLMIARNAVRRVRWPRQPRQGARAHRKWTPNKASS